MGGYTRVGLVRSSCGFTERLAPSGTVNFCITRGESTLRKYLRLTPATGSQTEAWVENATTAFACHYLALRLATQNIANAYYQRQANMNRSAEFTGQSISAEMWWNEGIRMCDMHGRDIIIERIDPS